MELETIHQFFQTSQPEFLGQELAVSYVLSVLLQRESYGTELLQLLASEYSEYRLSDTILHNALKFLEAEQIVNTHWKKAPKRGRPRLIYQLNSSWLPEAVKLANLWHQYVKQNHKITVANSRVNYPVHEYIDGIAREEN